MRSITTHRDRSPKDRKSNRLDHLCRVGERWYAGDQTAKTPGFGNHLLVFKARDGVPVKYFTGAGWNRSGQFADRAAWENYVQAFAAAVAKPLTITVSAKP